MYVLLQRRPPLLRRRLPVLPGPAVDRDHLLGRLGEGGHAGRGAFVPQRVAARAGELAVGERPLAGFGQRDEREAAEAEHARLAADHEPLHPTSRPGRVDVQVQAVAISVAAGLADVAAEGDREGLVGMPASALGRTPLLGQRRLCFLFDCPSI